LEPKGVLFSHSFYFDLDTMYRKREQIFPPENSVRYWTWTIVENNQEGGAAAPVPGVPAGTTALPTPEIAQHDVLSHPFTTPVLFSDVPLGAPFATEIYDLSDNGGVTPIINGFADGTFRPAGAVTRQAFAAFIARTLIDVGVSGIHDGPCTIIKPSAFPDVQNSSPFCKDIRDLSEAGVINGFSDLMIEVFGDAGRHARSAVGMAELPFDICVEVELIAELR